MEEAVWKRLTYDEVAQRPALVGGVRDLAGLGWSERSSSAFPFGLLLGPVSTRWLPFSGDVRGGVWCANRWDRVTTRPVS